MAAAVQVKGKDRRLRVVDAKPVSSSCSVITNGRLFRGLRVGGVDGRSPGMRRFKDLLRSLSADVGGFEGLGDAEKALVRQAAALTLRCEQIQAAIIRGEDVNHDAVIRLTSETRRVMADVRARAPAKPKTSVQDYLRERRPA